MSKTIEAGEIKYVKSPGPKHDEDNKLLSRTMIGTKGIYN